MKFSFCWACALPHRHPACSAETEVCARAASPALGRGGAGQGKGGAGRGKGGVGWGSHLEETDALDRDDGCREGWDGAWGGQDAALDGLGVQLRDKNPNAVALAAPLYRFFEHLHRLDLFCDLELRKLNIVVDSHCPIQHST
jgi:hypothetical protein